MKRSVIFLLAALLAASLVVPAMAEEPVTLRFWTDPRFRNIAGMEDKTSLPGEWEMIQAQEFMKLYPHVTIEVEVIPFEDLTVRVPAAIAAGGAPDILKDYLGRTAQYWHEGVLEPLEDLIPQDELADYLPSLVEMYTLDGHLHALPSYSWVGHLVANKAIWDEKGLGHLLPTIDNPSWTVEEFEAAIEAVKEDSLWPFGLFVPPDGQADYRYLAFFWVFGAKLYEGGDYSRVALNSPEGVEALTWLKSLNDRELIQPGATTMTSAQLDTMLWRGELATMGNTAALWSGYTNALRDGKVTREIDLVPVPYPTVPGVSAGLAVGPTGFAIFKQEDPNKLKWAVEFIRFLNQPEYQQIYAQNASQFPVRLSAGNPHEGKPHFEMIQKMLELYGAEDLGVTSTYYNQVRTLLSTEIQAVLINQKTPEQALADFEREANRILSR